MKCNQDENLELPTRDFYSRQKCQVTNSRLLIKTKSPATNSIIKIKIKISSYLLENFNLDENPELPTRELKSK